MQGVMQSALKKGNTVLIYTLTHYLCGTIVAVDPTAVALDPCCWVAEQGRMGQSFVDGKFSEQEPMPAGTTVNIDDIVIVAPWPHAVPKVAK